MRPMWLLSALIAPLLALSNLVAAAPYPERYITLIVPVPVGGAGDFIGRLIAERLSDAFAERVIVDDRAGASGTIAAVDVARSAPDGYTLLLSSCTTHGTVPAAFKVLAYDPIKDFTHIGLVATSPAVLSINAALPPRSVDELVAYAKRSPDQLNYGTSGVCSPGQAPGRDVQGGVRPSNGSCALQGNGPGDAGPRLGPNSSHARRVFPRKCPISRPAPSAPWRR